MRLILIAFASLVALAGLGLTSIDLNGEIAPEPAAQSSRDPDPRSTPAPFTEFAQASSKCLTSVSICFVPPLPVGSPCTCGDFAGVIIP
jgi:hypothetical protein